MIKSVIFVEAVQFFGDAYAASSYPWSNGEEVTATLRDGCIVFTKGEDEEIVPFANIKRISRKREAAKK